jgi:hypothetical protein
MTRAMNAPELAGAGSADTGRAPATVGRTPALPIARRIAWWEWALLLSFTVICFAVAGPRADAQPSCRIEPFSLVFGADTGVAMTVKAGTACTVAARAASAVVSHFEMEAQPSHGHVQRRGRTGAVYRADPHYRGDDSFGFALSGSSSGSRGTAIVRVKVTVR